jgi:hypothetical protein
MSGAAGRGVVVDVGGGRGFFAGGLLREHGVRTRVVDTDASAIEAALQAGVEAEIGDALTPRPKGDEAVICFNLVLHHLVGRSELETRNLQVAALRAWRGKSSEIFVNEQIYDSFFGDLSGRLIFGITSNPILSGLARQLARLAPSLQANTFGVGVRFRSQQSWRQLFTEAGFKVSGVRIGAPDRVSAPRRLLMIRSTRRDSFRLEHS